MRKIILLLALLTPTLVQAQPFRDPQVSGGLSASDFDTSAELRAILTDETGSGAACFATSPTLQGTIDLDETDTTPPIITWSNGATVYMREATDVAGGSGEIDAISNFSIVLDSNNDEAANASLNICSNGATYSAATACNISLYESGRYDGGINGWFTTGSDPADAGTYRLGNAQLIEWEASPAGTDVSMTVDTNEAVQFAGSSEMDMPNGIGTSGACATMMSGDICCYSNNGVECGWPTTNTAPDSVRILGHSAPPLGSGATLVGGDVIIGGGQGVSSFAVVQANCGAGDTVSVEVENGSSGLITTDCTRDASLNDATHFTCGASDAAMATNVAACLTQVVGIEACAGAGCTKFTAAAATVYVYRASNEALPALEFDVFSSGNHAVATNGGDGSVIIADGTAAIPGLSFAGTTHTTGFFKPTSGVVGITSGGTETFRFGSSTAIAKGTITSSATGTLGWSIVAGANTACTTTCTFACVFGFDTALGGTDLVDCADATADRCLCAGAN